LYTNADKIIYSPSDLTLYLESPFASWMEHFALAHPKILEQVDAPDPLMMALQKKGIEHEEQILKNFIERQYKVVQIEQTKRSVEDTIAAMQSGADVIYQAALSKAPFKGYADFLVRVDGQSGLGDYYYEVWDTKLSKIVKPYFIVQLCCYTDMLEALQERRPDNIVVVVGTGERKQFATHDYFYYYLNLKRRFLDMHQHFSSDNCPNPADSSTWGRWSNYAQNRLLEVDHLSQIATITRNQIKKLNQAGIHTIQEMVETPLECIKGMHVDVYARLKDQAKIQQESRGLDVPRYQILPHDAERKKGLSLLPPASSLDIYFDIEGFPLEVGGLEYLWGAAFFDEGVRHYKDFWAHDEEQEKATFQSFIIWVFDRWQRDPNMHIYHYALYEITACRKLMGRHGTCEYEVDQLLRNEVFVDLYKVVKGSLLLGEPRYSIKNVEHLYRSKRDTEVGSGSDSVVVYEHWREMPDGDRWETSKILNNIRDYNIDDCNSTQELVDWLRERQQEGEIAYLGKTEIVPSPDDEKSPEYALLREQLFEKSNMLSTQGAEAEAKIARLFAWSLEFHRREIKPMFWRLFDRLGSSEEELLDDIDCLALCERTERASYKHGARDTNLCYEYRFDPNQEFKAAAKKYKVLGQERADGKNLSVKFIKEESNLAEGLIVLKTGEVLERVVTLIPDDYINPDPIPAAIASVAEAFAQDRLEHTAIYDFLMRRTPRIKGLKRGDSIAPSHDSSERLNQIISAIKNLDNSYLTIQGPPGSGKSYTARHAIAELLKQGKKIGISSNGNKAINHLLLNTAKHCKNKGIKAYFSCTKDTDEALSEFDIKIYKNKGMIANYLPSSCVIGTTAWGFARSELEQAFDYLFIDEAGQVSVANLIAMSQSTRNIVLVGDQMQLGQPSQGSHPEESGLSILDYLLHTTPTIPVNMGVFLGTTYRMHSAVNQFISEAIYEGKLNIDLKNDRQRILVPDGYQGILNQEAGIISVPVVHEGNTQASDEEVTCIVKLANELLGRTFITKEDEERLLNWSDMLFVAPYNHQVNKLRLALGEQAKVGSVDKFQGQEEVVVFLSMCASHANESPRGVDFLFNKNRINVAVSRAKCMSVVVYSPTLLDTRAGNIGQMEQVNLFCKLSA
jgi:uncharacterized protein